MTTCYDLDKNLVERAESVKDQIAYLKVKYTKSLEDWVTWIKRIVATSPIVSFDLRLI